MIDQARLDAIHLHSRPLMQRVFGWLLLTPNYKNPLKPTRIRLEGTENIPPGGGSVFVMNHTDRYNYWPFQYELWKRGLGFTATWVKGKYYENAFMGWFMDANNNIPIPSKGYVMTKDFSAVHGRVPDDKEYAALKRLLDGGAEETARQEGGAAVAELLGLRWPETPAGTYAASLESRFLRMMQRVVDINKEALGMGLNLLIFPQGTRSVHLTKGHVGAAQIVLHTGATVVPVGCSGSDRCYPGDLPFSHGGEITYRIGKPLTAKGELAPFFPPGPFVPFTESATRYQPTFQKLTDLLMDRINDLVDPPYRYPDEAGPATGERGARRFV